MSFNPRAREGRDPVDRVIRAASMPVSIHAPVKGATAALRLHGIDAACFNPRAREGRDASGATPAMRRCAVSIHAPVKGATRASPDRAASRVSIHAPVKGATPQCRSPRTIDRRFNPRAREGRDTARAAAIEQLARFNPRAREGRDARLRRSEYRCSGFNPRAREGRDQTRMIERHRARVSIHAPVKGATRRVDDLEPVGLFQSTRP